MRFFVAFALIAVVLIFSSLAWPYAVVGFVLQNGIPVRIEIQAPMTGGAFRQLTQGNVIVWTNSFFQVRLTPRIENGITYLKLHIESFWQNGPAVGGVSLQAIVASGAIAGVWTPTGRPDKDAFISAEPEKTFVIRSAANYGIPYIAAADRIGANALALGLLQQDLPVEIRSTPIPGDYTQLSLSLSPPEAGRSLDAEFFLSNNTSVDWFSTAETYADWVDAGTNYSPFPISSKAYEPIYDGWYWSQDRVDDELYAATAEAAAQVGMGTYLADAGWDAPAGEYDKWLMGKTGDYRPPVEKFTSLPDTFDQLRSQFGLQVQLWLQPFAVGRNSARYGATRGLHIQIPKPADSAALSPFSLPLAGSNNLENVNLCPRVSATQDYLRNLFTEMSTTYHPDAYWLDFIDGMPAFCTAPHLHNFASFGAGFREALKTIRTTLLNLEDAPVVQFRAHYANLNNKSFANVWQPFDSPNDFERMRLDALRLRPFSKGVVFASDQTYWPSDADDETVARFVMAAVMSGVPSIGANLLEMSPSGLDIVANWMRFYRTYRQDLTGGRLSPFGSFARPNHRIESDERIFAYIRSNNRVFLSVRGKEQIFLLNASNNPSISATLSASPQTAYELQTLDRHLAAQGAAIAVVSGSRGALPVDAAVETGGVLMITKQE